MELLSWILHFLLLGLDWKIELFMFWGFIGVFEFIDLISLCVAVKAKAPDKAPADKGSSINQILGIKGAKQETVSHPFFSLFWGIERQDSSIFNLDSVS